MEWLFLYSLLIALLRPPPSDQVLGDIVLFQRTYSVDATACQNFWKVLYNSGSCIITYPAPSNAFFKKNDSVTVKVKIPNTNRTANIYFSTFYKEKQKENGYKILISGLQKGKVTWPDVSAILSLGLQKLPNQELVQYYFKLK